MPITQSASVIKVSGQTHSNAFKRLGFSLNIISNFLRLLNSFITKKPVYKANLQLKV